MLSVLFHKTDNIEKNRKRANFSSGGVNLALINRIALVGPCTYTDPDRFQLSLAAISLCDIDS
jgi:hypothetical protein